MTGFIGDDQVRAIKAKVDIVALMGEYTPLKKAGGNFVGCCAFHQERSPSMNVYPDHQNYHCFGCGAHGDAITLLREKERLEFGDAIELLARRSGHVIVYQSADAAGKQAVARGQREALTAAMEFATAFYEHTLWSTGRDVGQAAARAYLASRGLSEATCKRFRLGWAPGHSLLVAEARAHQVEQPALLGADLAVMRDERATDRFYERITFPICDRFGAPIAFSARLLPAAEAAAKEAGRSAGKYINSAGTAIYDKSRVVFNLHRARECLKQVAFHGRNRLVVMEGPTDVMAADQAGVAECVAVCGTALTVEQVKMLGYLLGERGHLFVLMDGDRAGIDAGIKAAKTCLAAGVQARIATMPDQLDPAEMLTKPDPSVTADPA